MSGIRVSTAVKRIEVNDNGEYIVLNFSDSSLPERFFTMLDNIQKRSGDVQAQAAEISEKCGSESEAAVRAAASLYRDFHQDIANEVDTLFGPKTCRKVFGDIVPDFELFNDFFTQLVPYFEEYGRDRVVRMSKYSANRTGNV